MLMRHRLLIALFLLAAALPGHAQFVLPGDDPGGLRWYSIQTPYYQVIYPEGTDSLARNYGLLLERYRVSTGRSLSVEAGAGRKRRMPVVLHPYNPYSNGSVAWAPRRMDLFTLPEAYGSDPSPWDIQLVTHEPRHEAQLELYRNGFLKPMSYVIGESWSPAVFYAYLSRCLAEGDAVTVETGLSPGTRARTADFLNYFQVAFDQGDWRNWYRWRYGSYKHYTPDFYRTGYMTVAGARYLYDDPLLLSKALESSRRKPWLVSTLNLRKEIQARSGKKFKDSYRDIMEAFQSVWEADAAARAPFMPMEQVSERESFPVDYKSPVLLDGVVYLLREGYLRTPELGYLEDGTFKRIRGFASHASALHPDPVNGRLYWSETYRNPRWTLAGASVIRYYDVALRRVHDLTREGRLYNPQPSPDGRSVAAVEYPYTGGSAVVVLDAADGRLLARHIAPDGIQASECAWLDGRLFVSGISAAGYGLYEIEDGAWRTELAPAIQKLVWLGSDDGGLTWVSDRDGVNALYRYTPADGRLLQLSRTRYGATDFCRVDGTLYSVSQTLDGKMLFQTPVDSLQPREVVFHQVHDYPVEDVITRQETALGRPVDMSPVEVSAPRRYYKLPHLMRFHTWAPVYFNYDAVKSGSMDLSFDTASPGLSAYFQNTLGTMSGMVGYSAHPDADTPSVWRHSLHASFTYSGWYPVLEGQVHFGDGLARQYSPAAVSLGEFTNVQTLGFERPSLTLSGYLRAYVPLSWSRGGTLYGLVPQVSYLITNSLFDNRLTQIELPPQFSTGSTVLLHGTPDVAQFVPMQRLSASVRGYVMQARAKSQVYPRWGIGLEAGMSVRPGIELFTPVLYAYSYAYLPGIWRTQGLRLTGLVEKGLSRPGDLPTLADHTVNTLPRGFSGTSFRPLYKVTADYAIPIFVGDIALPPVLYIRNFLLVPHFDYAGSLWSAGADLTAELGKLLMIPFDGSLGVSVSYLGGADYQKTGQTRPWSVQLIMSFDFL